MSGNDDIVDIIAQLQHLQLQQADLLTQLRRANQQNVERNHVQQAGIGERNANQDNVASEVSDTQQDLQVGDRVRILNPGRFQANRGTIIKIGANRVTVQASNGTKIQRAHHNIVILEE